MRVLVVEDNRELVLSVKKGLEQENISVDVAYDGESGEEKAFINSYDGILLDLNLPKKMDYLFYKVSVLKKSKVQLSLLLHVMRLKNEQKAWILEQMII